MCSIATGSTITDNCLNNVDSVYVDSVYADSPYDLFIYFTCSLIVWYIYLFK